MSLLHLLYQQKQNSLEFKNIQLVDNIDSRDIWDICHFVTFFYISLNMPLNVMARGKVYVYIDIVMLFESSYMQSLKSKLT